MICKHTEIIGCKSKSEMLDHSVAQPPRLLEIRKSFFAVARIVKAISEEFCRFTIHVVQSVSRHCLTLIFFIARDGNTRPLGEKFHSLNIVEIFGFFNKGYRVTARTAAEAIKHFLGGCHGKGRGFFAVEGAKTQIIRAGSFKAYVRAYKLLDIGAVDYLFDYFSRYCH